MFFLRGCSHCVLVKIGFFLLLLFETLMLYFGSGGTRRFISCQDGWSGSGTKREEGKEGRIRRERERERACGRPGEDGSRGATCIGSHCASNVITGGDSSVWHAALPICQSEIGRVTNGYHCDLPQPPPPPPAARASASLSSAGGGGEE